MKAVRSPSAFKVARTSVSERARRYAPPRWRGAAGGDLDALKKRLPRGRSSRDRTSSPEHARKPRTSKAVLRRIDPVSVLKVSVLFYLSLCIALFTAGILLWAAAHAVNLITNLESFMADVGFADFRLDGTQLLRALAIAGAALVVAGSVANLLMAALYNLISDVVGGVKVLLVEDDAKPKDEAKSVG